MNYHKIYKNIIEYRKNNEASGYTENHHIVPRSIGGTDDTENLVKLTAREHFICHYLLTKMYTKGTFEWHKMVHAFMCMAPRGEGHEHRYMNSRLYESARTHFSIVMSKSQSGEHNSGYGTMWIHNELLKQSIKIPKTSEIPDGWKIGRKVKWNDKSTNYAILCSNCNVEFLTKVKRTKFCSPTCRKEGRVLTVEASTNISIAVSKRWKEYRETYIKHEVTIECQCCNTEFVQTAYEKYCSEKCLDNSKNPLYGREQEFLDLYKSNGSMNKSLKEMGFPGAISHWYKRAKQILNE